MRIYTPLEVGREGFFSVDEGRCSIFREDGSLLLKFHVPANIFDVWDQKPAAIKMVNTQAYIGYGPLVGMHSQRAQIKGNYQGRRARPLTRG